MIKSNRIKFLLFWFSLIFLNINLFAQQLPVTNHYVLNTYAINPAIGGLIPYYDIKSNHRYQWVGLQDAPRTYVLSANGPLLNDMGVGVSFYTDNIGPISQTGIQGSYSYHLNFGNEMKLSFGLAMGFLHYTLDAQKIILHDPLDGVISESFQSAFLPDAKFGTYFSFKDFFIGFSVPQLIHSKINFSGSEKSTLSRLKSHYYLMGGYKYVINPSFTVEPSFLFKYINPLKPQLDISARVFYENKIWLAGSYRTHDSVGAMLGYDFKDLFSVAYSYDFTLSNLKNYSQGSHEIMIGVKLKKNKKEKQKAQSDTENDDLEN